MNSEQQNMKSKLNAEAITLLETAPKSALEIDYKSLEQLLHEKQWEAANRSTRQLILKMVNRENFWLRYQDIQELPIADLDIIDRLWRAYSNGQFGFTIQKQILKESYDKNSPLRYETDFRQAVADFGAAVGWSEQSERRDPSFPPYKWFFDGISLDEDCPPPMGHFPRTYELGGGKILAKKYYEADYDDAVQGILMSSGHYYNEREKDYLLGVDLLKALFNKIEMIESV